MALLDEARRGRSAALVVVGEPGVGKTALLEEAVRRASELRVLRTAGVESESELPFASLHAVLRPILDLLEAIPEPQARALGAALALEAGESDTLAVNAGVLSLLVEAADEQPVLVVVDDAHWVDAESAEALAFAARRLAGDDLALLVAERPSSATAFASFPRLELGPLSAGEARELLATRAEGVPAAEAPRFLAAAAGNPLAILELPVELTHDLPASSTPHERLRRAFAERVDRLPDASRFGLLLAAAEPDSAAVRRAATQLELDDPLRPAEEAGLILAGDGLDITFRHPVVRSLVYADAADDDRRTAHRALAAALDGEADLDRHAWHRAAAAEGPDEEAAELLERTAERAAARGGHAAQARALERAARLSPDRAAAARRLYSASRAAFWAGESAHARELAEGALPLTDDPLLRADLLQQVTSVAEWQGSGIPEAVFLAALEQVETLDQERVARMLYQVVKLRLDRFDAAGAVALVPRLEASARQAGPWWQPRCLAGAACAYLAAGEWERATVLFGELAAHPAMPAGFAYDFMAVEWYAEVRESLVETLHAGRTDGNRLRIVWNQSCMAHLELRLGRLGVAAAAAAEAISLGEVIGTSTIVGYAQSALAGVHAWRGQAEACAESALVGIEAARAESDRFLEGVAHQARALLALGAGRPEDAVVQLEPLARSWLRTTIVEPSSVPYLPDLVEAHAARGDAEAARAWLERFAPLACRAGRTWALAACARCEGLLAAPDAFDEPFTRSVELLAESPLSLDLARSRLAYGERLRRAGRRLDARAQLRAAHDAFSDAGAEPWRKRAAAELRAAGETVATEPRPALDLTPQELSIALLVAEGKMNKEIAAALYLSVKTVEYHLSNTFRKLGIHSRAELARIVGLDLRPA